MRASELGPALTAFVVFHALIVAGHVVLMLFALASLVWVSLTPQVGEDVISVAVDVPPEMMPAWALALAYTIGLGLLLTRHRTTRPFWTAALILSIVVHAYFITRGVAVWWSVVPMLISLGWLVYWNSSSRVRHLFP